MSVMIRCDGGCGATTKNLSEFSTVGYVKSRHYCEPCFDSVQEFLGKLDDIHTSFAKLFTEDVETIRKAWLEDHETGSLPDMLPPSELQEEPG